MWPGVGGHRPGEVVADGGPSEAQETIRGGGGVWREEGDGLAVADDGETAGRLWGGIEQQETALKLPSKRAMKR